MSRHGCTGSGSLGPGTKKNGLSAAFFEGRTGRTAFVALPASYSFYPPCGWLSVLNPTAFFVSGYLCKLRLGTYRQLPRYTGLPLTRIDSLARFVRVSVPRLRPPPPTLGEARTSFSRAVAPGFPGTEAFASASKILLPRLKASTIFAAVSAADDCHECSNSWFPNLK